MNQFRFHIRDTGEGLSPFLFHTLLAAALLALVACETPPQKPSSPPPPKTQAPPPEQQADETKPRQEQAQTAQTQGSQQPTSSSAQSTEAATGDEEKRDAPPPSNDTADVQITDIPVDEDGNPIVAPRPSTAPSPARDQQTSSSQTSSGGGGGSAMPPTGKREGMTDNGSAGRQGPPNIEGTEAGPVINAGAQTEEERLAGLEQDLEGKLAKFDELMRRARKDAEQERAAAGMGAGSPDGQVNGRGARAAPPLNGRGAGGQADTSSGLGHTPDLTGSDRQGNRQAAVGPGENDALGARDDDIVARQLREAATRESDPVLREKLWEEYRKYKKGISR